MNKKYVLYSTLVSVLTILMMPLSKLSAQNIVNYGGDSTKFYEIKRLSDSSLLVAGSAKSLDWIDGSVSRTELYVPQTENNLESSVTGINSFNTGNYGIILHISPDKSEILNVVHLPKDKVKNIRKIKSTEVPGNETGMIYISGDRDNPKGDLPRNEGYFIGKLNNNFVNGVPDSLKWTFGVDTRVEDNSLFREYQAWDVGNDGKVIFGRGIEFQKNGGSTFADIWRLEADGTKGLVSNWLNHLVSYDTTGIALNDTKDWVVSDNINSHDSIYKSFNGSVDSVLIKERINSRMVLKYNGTDFSSFDSYNEETYNDTVNAENNSSPERLGTYPLDMYNKAPERFMRRPNGESSRDVSSNPDSINFYKKAAINRSALLTDVAINRKTNEMYFTIVYTIKSINTNIDDQAARRSAVIAMDENGKMKWYARMFNERVDETGQTFIPDHWAENLAIDYKNDMLTVQARVNGKSSGVDNDLFSGDEVNSPMGKDGFQHNFTGDNGDFVSWLGKYNLNDGELRAATYIGSLENDELFGPQRYTNDTLNNWADLNAQEYDLADTRVHDLKTDTAGKVYLVGTGMRLLTTATGYQQMPFPSDGKASRSAFARVYSHDLSTITYSSILTGKWDKSTGFGGDNTELRSIYPIDKGLLTVGFQDNTGNDIPTNLVQSWGKESSGSTNNGIFAQFSEVLFINEPSNDSVICKGETIDVEFTAVDTLNFENKFHLVISDRNGSFENSDTLKTINDSTSATFASVTFPDSVDGNDYQLRVEATSPETIGSPTRFVLGTPPPETTPSGLYEVCAINDTSMYSIRPVRGIDKYIWSNSPTETTDSLYNADSTLPEIASVWNPDYSGGDMNLMVKTKNRCGISKKSTDTTITIKPKKVPKVDTITLQPDSVCQGETIKFTAEGLADTGDEPEYQWKLNGEVEKTTDTNFTEFSSMLNENDTLEVVLISSEDCAEPLKDSAKTIINLIDAVKPVVEINASADSICMREALTLDTTNVAYPGDNPSFSWQLNGIDIKSDTNKVTLNDGAVDLAEGDTIHLIMTSNNNCANPQKDTAEYIIDMKQSVDPMVDISASADSICPGEILTLDTLNVENGGTQPVFDWMHKGNPIANDTNMVELSNKVSEGDTVKLIMTSNDPCAIPQMDTAMYEIDFKETVQPSVGISMSPDPVCKGDMITFDTMDVVNGGADPAFKWMQAGNPVPDGNDTSMISLNSNNINVDDSIKVIMTSDNPCANPEMDTTAVTVNFKTPLKPSVSIKAKNNQIAFCNATGDIGFEIEDTSNMGPSPGYNWQINETMVSNSDNFDTTDLDGGAKIKLIMTSNSSSCISPKKDTSNVLEITLNTTSTPNVTDASNCSGSAINALMANASSGEQTIKWYSENPDNNNSASPVAVDTNEYKPDIDNNADGEYSYFVTQTLQTPTESCESNAEEVVYRVLKNPDVTANAQPSEIREGDSTKLTANGADIYVWQTKYMLSDDSAKSTYAKPMKDTTYEVIGIRNGCTDRANVKVTVLPADTSKPKDKEVKVYGGFTPNGDGHNDYFIIDNIKKHPDNTVKIFNRWGNLVYEASGYDNDDVKWDGTSQSGSKVPAGTYFYIIQSEDFKEAGSIQVY